jgi:D-alanyl-D-alanine carboxypeptidase
MIIEEATDVQYHELLRRHILGPLDMEDTFLEGYEFNNRTPEISEVYFAGAELSSTNLTFAWTGGGLVSTTDDLTTFITTLMNGGLFANASTLGRMTKWKDDSSGGEYGLGISRIPTPYGYIVGHAGLWGSFMYYMPEHDVVFTGTVNQPEADFHDMLLEILGLIGPTL